MTHHIVSMGIRYRCVAGTSAEATVSSSGVTISATLSGKLVVNHKMALRSNEEVNSSSLLGENAMDEISLR